MTTPTLTRTRPRALLAAVVVVVLASLAALSGCTSDRVVAYVEGRPVLTVTQLDQIMAGVNPTLPPDVSEADRTQVRSTVISLVVLTEFARGLAAEQNITITDAERAEALAQVGTIEAPEAQAVLNGFAESLAIQQKVGAVDPELWARSLDRADVEVNPRYGAWQKQASAQGGEQWGVGLDGSLSSPAAQPEDAVPTTGG